MIETDKDLSHFASIYIDRLTENIKEHANPDFTLLPVICYDAYELSQELTQEITGYPSAFSAINGDPQVLVRFAEDYARVGIEQYDDLCREALLDFLNLINGLFVVYLSHNDLYELSLSAPVNGENNISLEADQNGNIYAIPVQFSYGVVTFVLAEPHEFVRNRLK